MGHDSSVISTGYFFDYCTKMKEHQGVVNSILARDYKGFGHQGMNGVIENVTNEKEL